LPLNEKHLPPLPRGAARDAGVSWRLARRCAAQKRMEAVKRMVRIHSPPSLQVDHSDDGLRLQDWPEMLTVFCDQPHANKGAAAAWNCACRGFQPRWAQLRLMPLGGATPGFTRSG